MKWRRYHSRSVTKRLDDFDINTTCTHREQKNFSALL